MNAKRCGYFAGVVGVGVQVVAGEKSRILIRPTGTRGSDFVGRVVIRVGRR